MINEKMINAIKKKLRNVSENGSNRMFIYINSSLNLRNIFVSEISKYRRTLYKIVDNAVKND